MKLITVGIATLNRYYYLIKTIENVLAQQHPAVCEIIIVDQSDNGVIEPEEKMILQSWNDSDKIIWLKSNRKNLPAARNLILQKAKGEVILFLDDDVILPAGFIDEHYKHYKINNDLIAVAGLNYDRVKDCNLGDITITSFNQATLPHSGFDSFNNNHRDLIGANHSIIKDLASVEGYDENFIGYYEDTDMAKRIFRLNNGRIICDPKAWLIHLRAPGGGCRVTDNKIKRTEREIVGPYLLFAIRHLTGKEKWKSVMNTIRVGPLRKENVVKPWRQLFVWFQYFYAFIWAYQKKNKVKSPFVNNQ